MVVGLAINLSTLAWNVRLFIEIALLGSTVIVFELLGRRLVAKAWRALRRREVTFEFLFLMGIGGAVGMSIYSMIRGDGPVYFEVASMLLVVYAAGDRMGQFSREQGLESARAWQVDPGEVRRRTSCGHTQTVPLDAIEPGDDVLVDPEETIPVDGLIRSGEGFVRDAHISGEWMSSVKRPGDRVYAGSEPLDARLVVETEAPMGQRLIDSIRHSVEQAWAEPSEWQVEADRIVQWFFPMVVLATGGTFAYWHWTVGWQEALFNSLAVLLIACPCALGFAVPLAVWMTLGSYADDGLIAEGGDIVERMGRCDTVLFDKTGTLTTGAGHLVDLAVDESLPGEWNRREILAVAETLERSSQHPVAEAFQGNVTERRQLEEWKLIESRPVPGAGLEGTIRRASSGETHEVRIGTDALVPDTESARFDQLAGDLRADDSMRRIAIVIDERLVGMAAVAERPAQDLAAMLEAFDDQGLEVGLVTGDRRERAERLGFDHVYANMHPDEKRRLVENLHDEGHSVLFVGDGVNDASAMSAADVGIAKSSGSELTVDAADATWRGESPTAISRAVDRASRAVSLIRSNLTYAAAYNVAGIGAAAAGLLHPVWAAVLMVASSLFVTWRTALALE
jgi:heavy metal translocating P-type ATPase